jgi:uncharacterized repeat protein (TIGR03803 family)
MKNTLQFRQKFSRSARIITLALLALSLAVCAQAQTLTKLHDFCSQTNGQFCIDGGTPGGNLAQGTNGDIYGTTLFGGTYGSGIVYRISTAGVMTVVYSFCAVPCVGGSYPNPGLALGRDGNFYGSTEEGGVYGEGTVFKLTPAGALTTLHSFDGTDGSGNGEPALIQAANGNFYGTTLGPGPSDYGTVFEITAGGTFATLYRFCASSGCPDGSGPNGLMQAADGNFYGTTLGGGESNDCGPSATAGTFFQLTSSSGTLTTLDVFCAPSGDRPNSPVVQDAGGNFYGSTNAGGDGSKAGYGTVYEMTPTGSLTSLYSFCLQTGCPDGKDPQAPILGTDGNLYGTTSLGGANGAKGTIYEVTPAGQFTTLYSFTSTNGNFTKGSFPTGALLLHTNGIFYGIAGAGGKTTDGTLFSLATGLQPFVRTIPTSGAAGTNVIILGTNLTGATGVSFHGTAAKFKVVSASEITTTVPGGATSGTVTVTTAGGKKLNSSVTFQVP